MKRIFLFLILSLTLLLSLCSLTAFALKVGETTSVDVNNDGVDDFAVTLVSIGASGSFDLDVTEYVDVAVSGLAAGQTTKTLAEDCACFYTTAVNVDDTNVVLVETLCESAGTDTDGTDVPIVYYTKSEDGQCFKVTVIDLDPLTLIVEESDKCTPAAPKQKDFFFTDGTCFMTTVTDTTPVTIKVEETDLGNCGIETEYPLLIDGVCFMVEVLNFDPTELKVSEAPLAVCGVTPVKPGSQDASGKKPDSSSSSSSSSGSTSGGSSGGSMKGVPLKIPASNALFNDELCNNQLHKQKCVDGYKTYNCEAYNVKGEYKQYNEECASCKNQKQDHNEQGVDCGGVCPACPVSGSGLTQTGAQGTGDTPIVTKPLSSKWLIPLIILLIVAGVILSMFIWMERRKEAQLPVATHEEAASPIQGVALEKISLMKKYIRAELGKGKDRAEITLSLTQSLEKGCC